MTLTSHPTSKSTPFPSLHCATNSCPADSQASEEHRKMPRESGSPRDGHHLIPLTGLLMASLHSHHCRHPLCLHRHLPLILSAPGVLCPKSPASSLSHPGLLFQSQGQEEASPRCTYPGKILGLISGPGPLRKMVTSFRLGSKGIFHVCSPPSSWSVDSRCTLEAWMADSTHSAPGRQER